ncbi:hypothetical protein ABBQ32_006334 [Trebouxia sp. C0010 RCD-2024]
MRVLKGTPLILQSEHGQPLSGRLRLIALTWPKCLGPICALSDNVLLEAIQERASQSAIVNKTANCDATMDTAEVCCDSDCLCGAQCACGSNSRKSQPEVSTDMLPCVRISRLIHYSLTCHSPQLGHGSLLTTCLIRGQQASC